MTLIELKATLSKVHAVTVFRVNRAEVVRLFSIELKVSGSYLHGKKTF
jgi:hypothetical protein